MEQENLQAGQKNYLHNSREEIKHRKRIHRSSLTMKHKEKRLEYARQYQTMCPTEWQKVIFSDENKFYLDCQYCFRKPWHAKKF